VTYRLIDKPTGMRYAPCPWCGGEMRPLEYDVTETVARGWLMGCVNPYCGATGPRAGPDTGGREQAISANEKRIPRP
jgi:hypothetical protein